MSGFMIQRKVVQDDGTTVEVIEYPQPGMITPKVTVEKDGEIILTLNGREWDHLVRG